MLILGSRLLGAPVMSLQTGGKLATAQRPLIDPSNLMVIAYQVEGTLLSSNPSFLRTADIREFGQVGIIVNSSDEFVGLDDIISLKKIHDLRFPLIGLNVIDDQKHKLGKVSDFTIDTNDYSIQQLTVRRGFLRGITDTGLLINRSQIIEINNTSIVVKSPTVPSVEPVMQSMRGEFSNPFRSVTPQSNQDSTQ